LVLAGTGKSLNFNRGLTQNKTPLLTHTVNIITFEIGFGEGHSDAIAIDRAADSDISKAVLPGLPDANDIDGYRISVRRL